MATDSRKSRKSNFSQEEVDVLVSTVKGNYDLLYGETSKSFFHKEIRNQVWNIILEEVNKVSLERRTLNEVKNKWKKCQYSVKLPETPEPVENVEVDDLDSMPLQQRLSQNHNEPTSPVQMQETVLQSLPISPTKLKVTRQGKPQQPPPRVETPPPPPPQICLKWNSHLTNIQSAFPSLLTKEQYVDATLVSEGQTLKCHRMILSSCSPYFEEVFSGIEPFQHPVLFMRDTPFWVLKGLCDFMYAGEVHVLQDKLQEFLSVATVLKIKGLAISGQDEYEDVKPIVIPEIKQESDAVSAPKILEPHIKEEVLEELPSPMPAKHDVGRLPRHETSIKTVKPAKHEILKTLRHEVAKPAKPEVSKLLKHDVVSVGRLSKRKEEKKSKHASQIIKEKDKVVEELASIPSPKVAFRLPPKVVTKVVLPKVPKIPPAAPPKTTVKNVMKNIVKSTSTKPSTSKGSYPTKKSESLKRSEKHKAENILHKEKEKTTSKSTHEKEKPPLKKDNINDPLDLLQPVYEEIAKVDPCPVMKPVIPVKLRERGNVQLKKGVNRRVKKRRYAEYTEEREESPPPVFNSRKGTRSRPNRKIPKFFHTHYDDSPKESTDATIVREPHTNQNDPLIGMEEVDEIKAEPLDLEESTIEVEENIVNYMDQDQEMVLQEDEEIIGNYDSPLVNIKMEKRNTPNIFKKLNPQPVIVDVHTVSEPDVGLLDINQEAVENVQIVDISKISRTNITETIIVPSNPFDPITSAQEKPSEIIISSVQSMAEENRLSETEKEESRLTCEEKSPKSQVDRCTNEAVLLSTEATLHENIEEPKLSESIHVRPLEIITSEPQGTLISTEHELSDLPHSEYDPLGSVAISEGETILETEDNAMETETVAFRIEDVRTEETDSVDNGENLRTNEEVGEMDDNQEIDDLGEKVSLKCNHEKPNTEMQVTSKPVSESQEIHPEKLSAITFSQSSDGCSISTLGSLKDRVEALTVNSQDSMMSAQTEEFDNFNPKNHDESLEESDELCRISDTTKLIDKNQEEDDCTEKEIVLAPQSSVDQEEMSIAILPCIEKMHPSKDESKNETEIKAVEHESIDTTNSDVTAETDKIILETVDDIELKESEVLKPNTNIATQNIETELEECLASTSHMTEGKLKISAQPLQFEDHEDFTKDIEFDGLSSGNRPANYVGDDFGSDFEMIAEETSKTEELGKTSESEDVDGNLIGTNAEVSVEIIEGETADLSDRENGECKTINVAESESENLESSDNKRLEECKNTESEELEIMSKNLGCPDAHDCKGSEIDTPVTCEDTMHITETIPIDEDSGNLIKYEDVPKDAIEGDSTQTENLESQHQEPETVQENNKDVGLSNIANAPVSEYSDDKNIVTSMPSEIVAQENVSPTPEEEQRMEETLLADVLDDDVEMGDATTSQEVEDDGTEKTLEMIVNDLNESLGEMRK